MPPARRVRRRCASARRAPPARRSRTPPGRCSPSAGTRPRRSTTSPPGPTSPRARSSATSRRRRRCSTASSTTPSSASPTRSAPGRPTSRCSRACIASVETMAAAFQKDRKRMIQRFEIQHRATTGAEPGEYARERFQALVYELVMEREQGQPDCELRARLVTGLLTMVQSVANDYWLGPRRRRRPPRGRHALRRPAQPDAAGRSTLLSEPGRRTNVEHPRRHRCRSIKWSPEHSRFVESTHPVPSN